MIAVGGADGSVLLQASRQGVVYSYAGYNFSEFAIMGLAAVTYRFLWPFWLGQG